MAANIARLSGYHDSESVLKNLLQDNLQDPATSASDAQSTPLTQHYSFGVQFIETYSFANLFHPVVGDLIAKMNRDSVSGFFAGQRDSSLNQFFFSSTYDPQDTDNLEIDSRRKEIDISGDGPYANYNWELFFHIPLTVAVHLSKNQRFAEAQRWFHFIFNPLAVQRSTTPARKYWNFLAFRKMSGTKRIEDIIQILSTPRSQLSADEQGVQDDLLNGYDAIRNKPFQPHVVARTRHLAYQYQVMMKYLDNLIAWGDHLFQQDTLETINEATQLYVLAANILGPRPQQIPPRGTVRTKTFAQLKADGLGPIGNALVELEGQFPFNLAGPLPGQNGGDNSVLFGIGRTLYFCVPRNDKLLGYWDIVADRLFKIRHCMSIQGIVRPLALFDPPIDPSMLVKAAAAGLDVSGIIAGLNQPVSPVRCQLLIQKALELCGEVRGLGSALLAAVEKGDAEKLGLIRQGHEIKIQTLAQDVRFLQWKSAQESTTALLTTRKSALERLRFYQRLLGLPADPNAPEAITIDRRELTEANFDSAYNSLVSQYDKTLTVQALPALKRAGDSSPALQSGAAGQGGLHLIRNEDDELNERLPSARDFRLAASAADTLASVLTFIPDFGINFHFWGLGGNADVAGGSKLSDASKIAAEILRTKSNWEQDQAGMSSRTASYERRADEWILQYNLAAHELMQNGRQILSSLIAEQVAHREYKNLKRQIDNAQEVDRFLHDKFTNEDLYLWMQGEISRLYYEYYRFAVDTARKAERTMKLELMRPEVDVQEFVKFNYWDGGRKGLLSGEALYLDVKRMELAYHEHNKRELELTRHVSLRQLDPLALLTLKATGSCQVTIPEWLYDLDTPGHYLRRIKTVALSIPAVSGPYSGVNCTLSLLRSSLRKSPTAGDRYARQGAEDERFIDYSGAVQSIVTSNGQNDSGLFDVNLRDERFLPFEGAGAESTWRLDLPKDYRAFDYDTISDVIVHVRYTARLGVEPGKVKASLDDRFKQASQSNLSLLLNLRHEFPTEWAAFVHGTGDFTTTIRRDHFPYFTHAKRIEITGFELYAANVARHHVAGNQAVWNAASAELADKTRQAFTVALPPDASGPTQVLTRAPDGQVFLIIRYVLSGER